ncbi:hypothetical protein [Paenibacillus sp. NPDC058071]|uniref:hypothetical protein n=1 Tax=Paenibacillus sp. NPDC058071 TaxID=3346326 RepID=UPI0036DA94B6
MSIMTAIRSERKVEIYMMEGVKINKKWKFVEVDKLVYQFMLTSLDLWLNKKAIDSTEGGTWYKNT